MEGKFEPSIKKTSYRRDAESRQAFSWTLRLCGFLIQELGSRQRRSLAWGLQVESTGNLDCTEQRDRLLCRL